MVFTKEEEDYLKSIGFTQKHRGHWSKTYCDQTDRIDIHRTVNNTFYASFSFCGLSVTIDGPDPTWQDVKLFILMFRKLMANPF